MVFPILLINTDERQHIDGRFEHIDDIAFSNIVKAVPWITALHISLESISLRVGAAFVCVACHTVLVKADKHRIVIFGILIYHLRPGKE